ncbi:hypothetical protein BBK82_05745 [Lentzea guizhouensis]|uniref:DUF4082 domain-containing protein n=1 Tax=Lentzea guizhouensis TaxID=1586287 RepID=A0A1B2HD44_9PSEU|nr:hypothetical protein BBK82_05745 [Lentzea guizhouensis]
MLALVLLPIAPAHAADRPYAMIHSPSDDTSVPLNTPLVLAGGAVNGESGGITTVEFSTDGVNWTSVDAHTERWSAVLHPSVPGPVTILARARTASTLGPVTAQRTIHVGGTTTPPLYDETLLQLPDRPTHPMINDPDTAAVELGLRTRFDRPGSVTALVIRRGDHTGPVTARVWSPDGTLLAEQAAPGAQYSQRITFSTPIPVQPGLDYVVSYYTPAGGYAASEDYFAAGVANAPVYAGVDAGVHRYGGGFPTDTWHASNYWVAPVFQP